MYKFANYCQSIRTSFIQLLNRIIIETDDQMETNQRIETIFKEILYKDEQIGKLLLKFMFVDHYLILLFKIHSHQATKKERIIFDEYRDVHQIDHLLNLIFLKNSLISDMFRASIKFSQLNEYGKYCHYKKCENDRLKNMSSFHLIEKCNLEQPYTIEQFLEELSNITEEKQFIYGDEIKNRLLIESSLNYNSFYEKILFILKETYLYIKTLDINNIKDLDESDSIIISMIEDETIEKIIQEITHDDDILLDIIDTFISFQTDELEIGQEEIDYCYEQYISEEVKKKLTKKK